MASTVVSSSGDGRRFYPQILRKTQTFYEILEAASSFGWRNFDMTMLQLYREGLITEESAILYCTSKGVVSRGLDKIKKERGENTSGLTGLTLDSDYGRS